MDKAEAIRHNRGKVDKWILDGYSNADKFIYYNVDDPDLQKFKIALPEPPDWKLIDNYGLPAKDQYFQYEIYPEKLKYAERSVREMMKRNRRKNESPFLFERKIYDALWKEIEDKPDEYISEIDWIRRQWYFREFGKWVFIHGKPTFLDGWHFFYLNYWRLEQLKTNEGKPTYWERDRKWFHAVRYCYTTTLSPEYNSDGSLILYPDGTPKMKDMGARTVYGPNFLKGRRVGDSSKGEDVDACEVTSNFEFYNGIQGNKESTASGIYEEKFLLGFKKMPFFFRPMMASFNLVSEARFTSSDFIGGLNSKTDYATTAKRHYYDSKKINILNVDELGKTEGESVDQRHDVHKRCVALGGEIEGLILCKSTVDEMELVSAKEFQKLTRASHFQDRMTNGQTRSGLINIYFPIWESYQGFIGPYGEPIIDSPKDYQIPYMSRIVKNKEGQIMGCREYLENEEADIRASGDLVRLAGWKRMTPKSFRDCFANTGRNQIFNSDLLNARLNYLEFEADDKIRPGDIVPVSGFGGPVKFVDNPNGRFKISWLPSEERQSLIIEDQGIKRPVYKTSFIASADAYRLEKTDGYRVSDGGGAVYYKHDPNRDPSTKPVSEYETARFVCTYVYRPPTRDEYARDMLNMCILYGSMMYPEMNVSIVADKFIEWGFSGYLLYDVDIATGKIKNNPGWTTAGPTVKAKIFNIMRDWVNLHSTRCEHPEVIRELLDIEGPDDMKNRDLFVAMAGCLMGQESMYVDIMRTFEDEKIDVTKWI